MLRKLTKLGCWAIVAASPVLSAAAAQNKNIAAGKKIFESNCISCHMKTGKGSPMMAQIFKVDVKNMDLASSHVASMKRKEVIGIITGGKGGKMPTFSAKLKKTEIAEVAAYVQSLGGAGKKKTGDSKNSMPSEAGK
jgi:cbb3-type cytochrome c oxidase subunit III